MKDFDVFFTGLSTNRIRPYKWQQDLATPEECGNRLIRIPTGFGKTMGAFAVWAWHRVHRRDDAWPRRLVWCLPMRVLVEQTAGEIHKVLDSVGLLWDGKGPHGGKVGVHMLMGGSTQDRYYLHPEADAILVGTQDMLLSRALNRGYASPRARWPVEFGLLNNDALWIMDEVQLMDVGLATSVQLQAFRRSDLRENKMRRPCFTWWMSATLQPKWFTKSPDAADLSDELRENTFRIKPKDRTGHLWTDVYKQLVVQKFAKPKELANSISRYHKKAGLGRDGPTLVVLNTVERALEVYRALQSNTTLKIKEVDIRLIHSRFRPSDRRSWRNDFLRPDMKGDNRIIVSTQVVEAGVDISVPLLISELAPWPSLVQRLGRCARRGGNGKVVIVDFEYADDKKSAPYTVDDLAAALETCGMLKDASPLYIERLEEEHTSLLPRLYPYELSNLLLRHEVDELFDTSPDLSGADVDISRFIRSGDERDVHVFWTDKHTPETKPSHDELCSVPFLKARDWLCKPKQDARKPNVHAYVWSWLDRDWRLATRKDIYPGQTILVDSNVGGYESSTGWSPNSKDPVEPVQSQVRHTAERPCWKRHGHHYEQDKKTVTAFIAEEDADAAEEDDTGSMWDWQTIAVHCLEVSREVEHIASVLKSSPSESNILCMAGRWHDIGKSHDAFQKSIWADDRPDRRDIAKAPDRAWPCSTSNMYRMGEADHRRGFRHELAGAMALFSILQRHSPHHNALLGPWKEWSNILGAAVVSRPSIKPTIPEQEVIGLSAADFDLLAYLVCSHHGKVRVTWHASPLDYKTNNPQPSIRGIREGDMLPPLHIVAADGRFYTVPETPLTLSPSETGLHPRTGRSWTERVLNLMEQMGPFTLAWLEAIMRAADSRASGRTVHDTLLARKGKEHDSDRICVEPASPETDGAPATLNDGSSSPQQEVVE